METTINSFQNFPDWVLEKWQNIADLLAETIDIPAALIMKTENEFMEVFISSHSENNPYHVGGKEKWYGLYCETVIKTQNKLLVPDATKNRVWDKNPDIKLGMIAYLGFPLNFPDNKPFGTLCVLDNKARPFTLLNEKLIRQFKNVIELDLALIQSFELNSSQLGANVVKEPQGK
jgi:GAF domain-containing protein